MPTGGPQPMHLRPKPEQLVLAALALGAAVLLWASSALILPFPASANWYESAALFPRLMLALVIVGGLAELLLRARGRAAGPDTEELDSSGVSPRKAMLAVGLFMVYTFTVPWLGYATSTVLYVFVAGLALGLRARHAALLGIGLSAVTWLVFVQVLKVAFGHGMLP